MVDTTGWYPAAVSALEWAGESYGTYIQESISEHVAKGHYTHEYAMACSLGDMLAGNDGE